MGYVRGFMRLMGNSQLLQDIGGVLRNYVKFIMGCLGERVGKDQGGTSMAK